MEQNKHYSGLTFKEETGTRLWFETPDGIPIAFKGKEDFIETYKKHRRIEVNQWKENESEMLRALQEDCQNLNQIIQTMGEENFINSMAECTVNYEDVYWNPTLSDCREGELKKQETKQIYQELSFGYVCTLLRDIWFIHMDNLIGANEKVLNKYLETALEIESDTTVNMELFAALNACYGLFVTDSVKMSECIYSIYLSEEEMKLYRELKAEDALCNPVEERLLLKRLLLKIDVALLQDVLKICEQLCK